MEKVVRPEPPSAAPQDTLVGTLAALMLLAVTALGAAMQARRDVSVASRSTERQDHALYLWERVGVGSNL